MNRLALVAALGLAGCSLDPDPQVCTTLFAFLTVKVTDAAGQPVTDATVDVVRVATGRSIRCTEGQTQGCLMDDPYTPSQDGQYVVFHDGLDASRRGEDFRVTAAKDTRRAEAVLRIGSDGCHVEKRSGPDVLTLAP